MSNSSKNPVGLTKDGSWQIGARKTIGVELERAWQVLTSEVGLEIWLGEKAELADGDAFILTDGTQCEVRVFKPNSHLRMGWRPPGWDRSSTIQVRVVDQGEKTVIAFHQENMPSQGERQERRIFYKKALAELETLLSA